MTTQILTTKLFISAPGPNQVSRSRLLDRLQTGAARKLTLISAPAGYGKTTLLSEWICQGDVPFAWLSLDQHDNDLKRFLTYFIACLQSIQVKIDEQILNQAQSLSDPFTTILPVLINQISAAEQRFVLILDDYYLIHNKDIHQALIYLLDNLPQQMRLAIATRIDPPLRLAQLRAQGELCEIRAEDLRFTFEEAFKFLNQIMNLGLTPVDIATLTEKTEGWIAGLQLASISLQGHHDKQAFVRTFAGDDRHVADYLLDEILDRQAPHIQTFLLQTSILSRLSAPLCDAVTNRNDSQAILAELERANLFLVPLDNQRSWYRYHHLFAELLQVRLLEIMPDEVHNLYRLTSAWHERKGLFSQAASYALKGGDLKGVSRLVERNAFTLVDAKELSVLAKQLDMLPDEEYKTDPWIALTKAWIQAFTGNFESVEPLLQRIEGMIEEIDSPDFRRVLGRIISLRAYMMSGLGKKKDCIQLAQKAMDQLPEDDVIMRCFTLSSMGNAHRDIGNLQTAVELLNRAALIARAANDSNMSVMILCRLVAAQRMIGQLNQAQNSCYEALEIAQDYKKRTGRNLPIVAYAHFRMGELLYAQNDLENAMRLVEDGLSLSEKWGHFDILLLGLRTKTKILQALGIREGLLDAVQQSYRIRQGITLKSKKKYPTGEADYRLVLGDLDWLGNWVLCNRMDVQDEIRFQDYYSYFIFLRFLKAQGPLRKYEFLLNRLLDVTDQAGAVARKIELMTMQAVLYFEKGDLDDALVILEQAFSMAEPEGFVRVFLNQGESMAQLLYQAAIQGIRPEFCNRLLAQFSTQSRAGVSPQDDLVEPLSDREKEVLKFIAQGATNQEIAQELILSLHTVKSHARHIYGKLGVKNRTEAVARARLIGLLPQD